MNPLIVQTAEVWHRQGMFMGMHWAWWFLWIGTIAIVAWAFYRLAADRMVAKREAARIREAETELRLRHARGEIDDQELARELTALLTSATRYAARV